MYNGKKKFATGELRCKSKNFIELIHVYTFEVSTDVQS